MSHVFLCYPFPDFSHPLSCHQQYDIILHGHLPNSHMPNSQFPSSALDAKLVWHLHLNDPLLQSSNLKWLSSPPFTLLVLYIIKYWPSYLPSTQAQRLVTLLLESYFLILSFSKSLPRVQVKLKASSFEEIIHWIFPSLASSSLTGSSNWTYSGLNRYSCNETEFNLLFKKSTETIKTLKLWTHLVLYIFVFSNALALQAVKT